MQKQKSYQCTCALPCPRYAQAQDKPGRVHFIYFNIFKAWAFYFLLRAVSHEVGELNSTYDTLLSGSYPFLIEHVHRVKRVSDFYLYLI